MKNLEHKETKETKTTTQPTSTSTENIQNFFPRPGVLDAAGQNQIEVFGVFENKPGSPERVIHPGTAKLFEVHS